VTPQYHAATATAVATDLAVDPTVGLATDDANRRARTTGPNALEASKREPLWRMLLKAGIEPFVALAGGLAILVGEVGHRGDRGSRAWPRHDPRVGQPLCVRRGKGRCSGSSNPVGSSRSSPRVFDMKEFRTGRTTLAKRRNGSLRPPPSAAQ
jgi:hypothetical protein